MPFNKINIKVGDKIDTREFFSPTKNGSGKYHELKPPIEVVSIYGESVTVAYTFTYRKKSFTRAEVRNKTDIETKLYRKSYTLIQ